MTNRELKKLSRNDLLELMLAQSRELDQLRERLRLAEEDLNSRQIGLDEVGSIAEASLKLNGVFQAAQDAASQYLENVKRVSGHQKEICARMERESRRTSELLLEQTRAKCQEMEEQTRSRCRELLEAARREARAISGEPCAVHSGKAPEV